MAGFRIILDPSSLRSRGSGSVVGNLWFEFDASAFPEPGWGDFPLVVLGWWCNEISSALLTNTREVELDFMDGPFSVAVHLSDDKMILAPRAEGRGQTTHDASYACEAAVMVRELLAAARTVLVFCQERGIESTAVSALREASDRLAGVLPS